MVSFFIFQRFTMINIAGVISVILFYLLILGVGMWASRKQSGVEGIDQEVTSISIFRVAFLHQICLYALACLERAVTKLLIILGRGYVGGEEYWNVCWNIHHDCNMGWWWVHQWHCRNYILKRFDLVPSTNWIRFEFDAG